MVTLAVSNLAWMGHDEKEYLPVLLESGVTGIEIAPGLAFGDNPTRVPGHVSRKYARDLQELGLTIVGLQAIFFQCPDIHLISTGAEQRKFVDHCKAVVDLCAEVGGKSMVIGAPANRKLRGETLGAAVAIAAGNLRLIGDYAAQRGTYFTIEALPASACCEFICNLADATDLVRLVDSPGVRGHLDTGAACFESEEATVLPEDLGHVHVNDFLMQCPTDNASQRRWANRVLESYQGVVSIEMRAAPHENERQLRQAIQVTKQLYCL